MQGRKHVPTDEQRRTVETMAGFGIPETDIARVLGINPETLRIHYRDELDTGHVKANAKVAQNLFRLATGTGREAVTAAIFWMKTRAGWRERGPDEEIGKKERQAAVALDRAQGKFATPPPPRTAVLN